MSTKATKLEKGTSVSDRMRTRTFFEVWKDWFVALVKYIWKKLHSPLGVWMFSTWLVSVIIMGVTNTLRGDSFLNGPHYWLSVFLTYGLNVNQNPDDLFVSRSFLPWIFAPMIVLTLGVTLYILPESGYFRNGAFPIKEKDFKSLGFFFNDPDIWGSELIDPAHPKWTKTYIWIVFMPIILGAIIGGLYNFLMFKVLKKQKRYLPKAKNVLLWHLLACVITAVEMALMTGDIELRFSEIFYSLFVDRKSNKVFIYGLQYGRLGQYHPISLSLSMWIINLTAFFLVYIILITMGNLDKIAKNIDWPYRKVKGMIEARKAVSFVDIDEYLEKSPEETVT